MKRRASVRGDPFVVRFAACPVRITGMMKEMMTKSSASPERSGKARSFLSSISIFQLVSRARYCVQSVQT
jgi:hypothetical protein